MSNYLVLHFDVEFIAGIVYTGNGNSIPINNEDEELLWLYFFNDPHQNRVTFGNENKKHFNNLELNYYGNFINQIADENVKFNLRGIQRPVIDFLEYSGLLGIIQKKYSDVTNNSTTNIPTLITFSLSINDISKIKIINYLKSKNFIIVSFSIPLSELVCYHYWKTNKINAKNGKIVLLMKATNSTLHLMKLIFADDYFLLDGTKTISLKGQGYDPRKKSIVNFVVNEVNKSTGVIGTQEELDFEFERYQSFADEWLKRLDANSIANRPIIIRSINLSPAPSINADVLVRKTDIECDTGSYIKEIEEQYNLFEFNNIIGKATIASVILFGDCFNNNQIKKRFENQVDKDCLLMSNTNDIFSVMAAYPTIDFNRYADTEERIKVQAKLDELEAKKRQEDIVRIQKEKEEENTRLEELRIIEKNKRKAKEFLDKARDLSKLNRLLDAKVNVENGLELDPQNKEILDFFESLMKRLKNIEKDTERYKVLLVEADELMNDGNCNEALVKYEQAKSIADGPVIRNILVETRTKIEELENRKQELNEFLRVIESLVDQEKFEEAKSKAESLLHLYGKSDKFNIKLNEINYLIGQQEIIFNKLINEGDSFFTKEKYVEAEQEYHKALTIKSNSQYCESQLKRILEIYKHKAKKKEEYAKALKSADEQFINEDWGKAKEYYNYALKLFPNDIYVIENLKKCDFNLTEIDRRISVLQLDVDNLISKGKKQQALRHLEDIQRLRPKDKEILSRIKKIKFEIDFDEPLKKGQSKTAAPIKGFNNTSSGSTKSNFNEPKTRTKNINDDFFGKAFKPIPKIAESKDDDFLGNKSNGRILSANIKDQNQSQDDFIKKSDKTLKRIKPEFVNNTIIVDDNFINKSQPKINKSNADTDIEFISKNGKREKISKIKTDGESITDDFLQKKILDRNENDFFQNK